MSIEDQIAKDSVRRYASEAKDVADHLDSAPCPPNACAEHGWMLKGVKLCLRLLLCIMADVQSPRRQVAMNGAMTFAVILIIKVFEWLAAKHGVDPAALDAIKTGLTSMGAGQ